MKKQALTSTCKLLKMIHLKEIFMHLLWTKLEEINNKYIFLLKCATFSASCFSVTCVLLDSSVILANSFKKAQNYGNS